jgi:RNA polymerase sigma-70 factor (ECF subfamily)
MSTSGRDGQDLNDVVHADRARVRRILAGDRVEFRRLFDAFFPRLYRFALARLEGDHDAANEAVQVTFCRAIERLDDYRGEAALYTWFCQICRNAIVDHWRTRNRERRLVVPLEDQPGVRAVLELLAARHAEEPDAIEWRDDLLRLVQATVDALPEHYAQVLEWKYIDALPVREIAARLAVGEKAAESLLTRARAAFRAAIEEMADGTDLLQPLHEEDR